jgi:hypothetical protein
VYRVCAQRSAVEDIDECSMMLVIQADLYGALTVVSMTPMILLTYILLV